MFHRSLFIVSLLIPYPSIQHFVWPLHWCLLADICNHTWIPECGTEKYEDKYNRRLFIDECDMYEYNCDYESDYYAINYSDCFNIPPTACPTRAPCPSVPTCRDHRYHRMGDRHAHERRMPIQPTILQVSLPLRMLKGRRRYSPSWRKKKRRTTHSVTKTTPKKTVKKTIRTLRKTMKTISMRKKATQKGKKTVKVVTSIVKKIIHSNNGNDKSDGFLE